MKVDDLEEVATHKGTGFARFKNAADADAVADLSQSLEK